MFERFAKVVEGSGERRTERLARQRNEDFDEEEAAALEASSPC